MPNVHWAPAQDSRVCPLEPLISNAVWETLLLEPLNYEEKPHISPGRLFPWRKIKGTWSEPSLVSTERLDRGRANSQLAEIKTRSRTDLIGLIWHWFLQYTCYFIFVVKENLGRSSTIKTHLAQAISGDSLNVYGSYFLFAAFKNCSSRLKSAHRVLQDVWSVFRKTMHRIL